MLCERFASCGSVRWSWKLDYVPIPVSRVAVNFKKIIPHIARVLRVRTMFADRNNNLGRLPLQVDNGEKSGLSHTGVMPKYDW